MAEVFDYSFAQQADLELALGGAHVLVQLADPDKTGVAQQSIVNSYLEDGASEVRSAVEVKHDPETLLNLDEPSLRRLVRANANSPLASRTSAAAEGWRCRSTGDATESTFALREHVEKPLVSLTRRREMADKRRSHRPQPMVSSTTTSARRAGSIRTKRRA